MIWKRVKLTYVNYHHKVTHYGLNPPTTSPYMCYRRNVRSRFPRNSVAFVSTFWSKCYRISSFNTFLHYHQQRVDWLLYRYCHKKGLNYGYRLFFAKKNIREYIKLLLKDDTFLSKFSIAISQLPNSKWEKVWRR